MEELKRKEMGVDATRITRLKAQQIATGNFFFIIF